MMYHQKTRQVSYGEAIGILLLDSPVPFIPGDVANATTYDFPVRFQKVAGFSVEKALNKDESIYSDILEATLRLKENGVKAVTGNCGFMAVHQKRLKQEVGLPIFLSSLFQIPFIRHIISDEKKIGIITASGESLTPQFLEAAGIRDKGGIAIQGLEIFPEFKSAVLSEKGSLDSAKIEAEVVQAAENLKKSEKRLGAILLECSVLPPYSRAVQASTDLPVFDYITMINYVFAAIIQKPYNGFM